MEEDLPREVPKPWGSELWIAQTDRYAGKILRVRAGCRLSVQFHEEKDETSYVLSGRVIVSQGDSTDQLTAWELGPASRGAISHESSIRSKRSRTPRSSRSRRRSLRTLFAWRTDTGVCRPSISAGSSRPIRKFAQATSLSSGSRSAIFASTRPRSERVNVHSNGRAISA